MSSSASAILKSALALSEDDRLAIADALLATLPEDDYQHLDEEAFAEELKRRSEDKDRSAWISWADLKKQIESQ